MYVIIVGRPPTIWWAVTTVVSEAALQWAAYSELATQVWKNGTMWLWCS